MAFEEAIADGVDVISISNGADEGDLEFYNDNTAIGAFNAVRKGIFVSAAAGNSGPKEFSVGNTAPWYLTVAASTMNRQFPASVVLGNGEVFTGASLYVGKPLGAAATIPLVYGGDVGSDTCLDGSLNASLVTGKIVLCGGGDWAERGEAVRRAGGVGAILAGTEQNGEDSAANAHVIPAAGVTLADAQKIYKYISTHTRPVATIKFHGTVVGSTTPSSPRMASFSSRGPSTGAPGILKPDVTAPGVDILGAWTGEASPTGLDNDPRRVEFNIISGTSMLCPHVSGIAALLWQARPDWSPAAIKSALMTTASVIDSAGHQI